mmetsp:Transcript_30675/g.77540  ORF Transcript_30675/g.77540 Transcript_30675/m.77540 type:complete len:207 (-) Transcript_30675:760-1380(-)
MQECQAQAPHLKLLMPPAQRPQRLGPTGVHGRSQIGLHREKAFGAVEIALASWGQRLCAYKNQETARNSLPQIGEAFVERLSARQSLARRAAAQAAPKCPSAPQRKRRQSLASPPLRWCPEATLGVLCQIYPDRSGHAPPTPPEDAHRLKIQSSSSLAPRPTRTMSLGHLARPTMLCVCLPQPSLHLLCVKTHSFLEAHHERHHLA